MTPAFNLFKFINGEFSTYNKHPIKNLMVSTVEEIHNDYHTDQLPIIPINTVMMLDFGGDFGIYAMADIGGVLHRIQVPLNEIGHIDWSPHEDAIEKYANPSAETLEELERDRERMRRQSERDSW